MVFLIVHLVVTDMNLTYTVVICQCSHSQHIEEKNFASETCKAEFSEEQQFSLSQKSVSKPLMGSQKLLHNTNMLNCSFDMQLLLINKHLLKNTALAIYGPRIVMGPAATQEEC